MQQVEDSAIQHMFLVNQTIMASAHAAFEYLEDDTDEDDDAIKLDHRWLPRNERKVYDRDFVLIGLNRDYLGPKPLFDGREFDTMFRISKARFERLLQDVGNNDIHFYTQITDRLGKVGHSMEARLLIALKTIAYGVPPHMLRDQFQMSKTLARKCCIEFDLTIMQLYTSEYLRLPDKNDLVALDKLHY